MKIPILLSDVVEGLNELGNRELQERLWLSDGTSGEVSSFEEAVCGVFDDGGVTRALESNTLPASLQQLFQRLDGLLDTIPDNVHPSVVIEHPIMKAIRGISVELLQELQELKCQERTWGQAGTRD